MAARACHIASAAALAYIEGVRAARAVQDAQANLDLAQGLARLAHQQHDAGAATGVDVARAETHVAEDQQNLIQARLAATQAVNFPTPQPSRTV